MADLAVVMPSTPARAAVRALTCASLCEHGFEPLVYEDDPPQRTLATQGRASRLAIAQGLDTGASRLLFCEDDLMCAPEFGAQVWRCMELRQTVALYLPGRQFYPAGVQRMLASGVTPETMFPIIRQRQWWCALCVLLTRDVALAIIRDDALAASDGLIQRALHAHASPLWSVVPQYVAHRNVPSSISPHHWRHRSTAYVPR